MRTGYFLFFLLLFLAGALKAQTNFAEDDLTAFEVEDIAIVNVFPIPANKYFNVSVPSDYYGGEIVITDVVGKTLKREAILEQPKVKVLTEGISSGIYFVSVDHTGERVFTQRIVIDK